METQTLNQTQQFQPNNNYSEYVKKALEESEQDFKNGNTKSYNQVKSDVKAYFDKKCLN